MATTAATGAVRVRDLDVLPGPLADAARIMAAALDTLLAAPPRDLDGVQAEALASVLYSVSERAQIGAVRCLPVIETDGLWALDGHRSFAQWVARRLGTSVARARQDVRLGRTLRDALPRTAEAASAGRIGTEAAAAIAGAASTDARRDVLADADHECGEAFLVDRARALPVDDLRTVVRAWAEHADPEADDRGYREADEREFLELARLPFGYRVRGQLTVEHAQVVKEALVAVMPVPARTDPRSTTQRRAQGLADLARVVLDRGLAGTEHRARPHLTVLIDHTTMQSLVDRTPRHVTGGRGSTDGTRPLTPSDLDRGARFDDGTRVPRHVLDRLACDGELNRVLFTPNGEVLEAGRTVRLFTGAKRAAIVARDRHCTYPGCTAPPQISDGHHVDHWARDHGRTDVDRGVLLCYHHHHLVHVRDISVRRCGRSWQFTDRWGAVLRE